MTLFRLFHVSDLHFGDSLRQRVASRMPGWEIHDSQVISRLAYAVRRQALDARRQNIPFRIVCSGDLTTWGSKDAITLAANYLSDRPIVERKGSAVALPDADAPYLPGNHDVWNGWFPLLVENPCVTRTRITSYGTLYQQAAPGSDCLDGEPFPYRLTLFEDARVSVRLYGLDSTRLDLVNLQQISILRAAVKDIRRSTGLTADTADWLCRALRATLFSDRTDGELRRALAAIAAGFLDDPQIVRLARLLRQEAGQAAQDERNPSERIVVRLAMLHHPLAFRETPPEQPDYNPDALRGLLNLGLVQAFLQAERFFGVLCGHQHDGFVRAVRPDPRLGPLYVFSTGTSGQKVSLTPEERQLIRRSRAEAVTEEAERERALAKLNEFTQYELRHGPARSEVAGGNKSTDRDSSIARTGGTYEWVTRVARFLPHRSDFFLQDDADAIVLPLFAP